MHEARACQDHALGKLSGLGSGFMLLLLMLVVVLAGAQSTTRHTLTCLRALSQSLCASHLTEVEVDFLLEGVKQRL